LKPTEFTKESPAARLARLAGGAGVFDENQHLVFAPNENTRTNGSLADCNKVQHVLLVVNILGLGRGSSRDGPGVTRRSGFDAVEYDLPSVFSKGKIPRIPGNNLMEVFDMSVV
jgi:hypothetical protein